MALSLAKNIVQKKDSEGDTYSVAETAYKDGVLTHMTILGSLDKIINGAKEFTPRVDDIWIVGYPKSGIHWVSEVVNGLLSRDMTPPFAEAERILEMTPNIESMEQMDSPRVLNTYVQSQYLPENIKKTGKMVFVIRNPKSVAVSYYHHFRTFKHYDYSGTFSGFLKTFIGGLDTLYGSWFDMVTGYWNSYKDDTRVHFVFYEDLLKNAVEEIKAISNFLALNKDMSAIEEVAERTRFEAMKAKEQPALVDNPMINGTEGIYRKGIATDWETHFSNTENQMFNAVYKEKMEDFPDLRARIRFEK